MVTYKKFLKLIATREEKELETLIIKMTEADAKDLLKAIICQMNGSRYEEAKAMGFIIDEG